jgi:hypothetical protein
MSYTRREVVVTDIRMPFWSIVIFMVKFSVASIPAMIILYAVGTTFVATVARIVGSL